MSRPLLALILVVAGGVAAGGAVAFAGEPGRAAGLDGGEALAMATPWGPLQDAGDLLPQAFPPTTEGRLLFQALPPPPDKVVRRTRYYGTVTIDHRAHLKRRAACSGCHGPGQVSKIEFTPPVAHQRCIGCHKQASAGPTTCRDCHVKEVSAPPVVVAAAATQPAAPPPNAVYLAAVASAEQSSLEHAEEQRLRRVIDVGCAAGDGWGPAVRVSTRQDWGLVTHEVEHLASASEARTIGLMGFGLSRDLHSRVALEAVALGGFDVIDKPYLAFTPSVGARLGVVLQPRWQVLQTVNLGITGVVDLLQRGEQGERVGNTALYATISTGLGRR